MSHSSLLNQVAADYFFSNDINFSKYISDKNQIAYYLCNLMISTRKRGICMDTFMLAEKIKGIRKHTGMSMDRFADYLDIPKNTHRNYENGEFPMRILDALDKYHVIGKVSYDFLLDDTEQTIEDAELYYQISHLSTEEKELVKNYISLLPTNNPKLGSISSVKS